MISQKVNNYFYLTVQLLTGGMPFSIQSFMKFILETRSTTHDANGFRDGYAFNKQRSAFHVSKLKKRKINKKVSFKSQ